jgi:predicted dehydrogenase
MKIAVLGLGSMGKRRVRNLHALGETTLVGFDVRADRRKESETKSRIQVMTNLEALGPVQAAVISTPPERHAEDLAWCLARKIPCFVELNVVPDRLKEIDEMARASKVLVAPSCSFLFHPAIQQIREIVGSGRFGRLTGFIYHSGHYLPDWHPWESVQDFFVRNPATSGCRELLSFEFSWLFKVFGRPTAVTTQGRRTLDFGLASDDSLSVQIEFQNFLGVMLVDVVSRFATRSITINMEKVQIRWNWEDQGIRVFAPPNKEWAFQETPAAEASPAYKENLTERMYVDEMRAFLEALAGRGTFPSSLEDDLFALNLIADADRKEGSNK